MDNENHDLQDEFEDTQKITAENDLFSAFIGLSFETVNKAGEFFETEGSPAILCVKLSYRK